MKTVPFHLARSELASFLDRAQTESILITRHGKPAAVLLGVEGEAIEELLTASSPEFWAMIEERRANPRTISAHALRAELKLPRRRTSERRRSKRSP